MNQPLGRAENPISSPQVLAWGSVSFGFGLILGSIYLKSYWGVFGLDPFQFGHASDLALVGLTGVGVTVAFTVVAALLGGHLGRVAARYTEKYRVVGPLLLCALVTVMVVLLLWVKFGRLLVGGILLTWFLTWLVHRSPEVPEFFRALKPLPFLLLALAYIPMGAHYLGQRRAHEVISGQHGFIAVMSSGGTRTSDLRLAGRLGDIYVMVSRLDGSVVVVPQNLVSSLTLRSKQGSEWSDPGSSDIGPRAHTPGD